MLSPEQRLLRAAMSFGAWQERAVKSKDMENRKKFVRAENTLGLAAVALYQELKKRNAREKRKRSKS